MSLRSLSRLLAIAGLPGMMVACLLGCSKGTHGVEVKGKVLLNDQPLSTAGATTAVVFYEPDARKGNQSKHPARGTIDAQGEYTLTSDNPGQQGIPVGWYKVGVIVQKKDPKHEYGEPTSLIPEGYRKPGISIEVRDNAPAGAYTIKLRR
jgi:hypothetical protein